MTKSNTNRNRTRTPKPAPLIARRRYAMSVIHRRLFDYLLTGKSLTALDGVRLFECLCTTQRLSEMRNHYNIPIRDEYFVTANGKRLKRYYLDSDYIERYKAGKVAKPEFSKNASNLDK